jgi:tetratricopeptide (TPR) repeat protein
MSRPRIAALGLFLWLGCAAGLSAADWPVPRGPSREPQPYHFDAAVLKEVPREFLEDAPACVVYSGVSHLLEADGTVETVTHELTRFNGRKGIDKLGEYRNIFYAPAYQKLTLNEARVHKPDGRVVAIEPRHVQLRDLATDYQVYDHDKQLIISFPNLEVGDVIEVKWTTRGKNPEHQGHLFGRYSFGADQYPCVLDELRIRLPGRRTLKQASIGAKLEPTVRREGGFRLYRWQVRNRPQLPQYDDMPSKELLRLTVAFSTFGSWEEVHRWKQKLRADCWECTDEIRKVVEEVTRGLPTPLAKARALTYWVRRNIRYVSAGETHDYTPHRPAAVLANRFGDCKDQSQLLAVMLREAGVPVALATLGTRDDGQVLPEVPSPWGTHAILLVTLDGQDHWIDTTANLAGWDFLPPGDRDRLCYVTDDKEIRLVRTPPLTPELMRYDQATTVRIAPDGSSRCERTTVYHGLAALNRRDDWLEAPVGERRRLMTAELQDANSRTRLRELAIDEKALRDFDRPVSARAVFDIPGHFTGESDREGSVTDSKVWGRLLAYNLDYDRPVALDLGTPFESRHRYVIELPAAFRLADLPTNRHLRSKWGFFRLTVQADADRPRVLELEFHTRLEQPRIDPADFDEFRRFHEGVAKHYRVWLTLRPTTDLADAPALEKLLEQTPDDAVSAVVLARLYQHNGLAKEARRVLREALKRQPGDPALLEQLVKSAETLEEEEAAYRELIRRFPEEPKYAVSLGAALIGRSEYGQARQVLAPVAAKGPPPGRAQAHYHLARCCLHEDRPDKAFLHLEACALADPETARSVRVLMLRGGVLEKLNQPGAARGAYREALKIEPDGADILAALVRLALAADDRAEALDYLRRYTVTVGNNVIGLVKAAEWHLSLGRFEDAFDLACRAREIRFHERAQRVLGLVYLHRGDSAKAVFHLEKAEADAPVTEALIRGYLALGRLRDADEQAGKARRLEAPPSLRRLTEVVAALMERRGTILKQVENTPARDGLGRAVDHLVCAEHAWATGQPPARVEALLAGAFADEIELGPALALRGLLALEKGKLSRALTDAERSIALSPAEPRGYYVRGRIRLERGDSNGALTDLSRAAELGQRKDAVVLHWLAAALFRTGRTPEALATQRQAVQLRPRDPEFLEQLRELEKAGKSEGPQP